MIAFGATREEAEATTGAAHDAVILPTSLAPLIDLAQATRGQWRMASGLDGGRPIALDNGAVQITASWLGIEIDREMAMDLMIIEDEALKVMNGK